MKSERRHVRKPPHARYLALLAVLLIAGCIHRFYESERTEVEPPAVSPVLTNAKIRAHLIDGGVAIFERGGEISPDAISGRGVRYDITRNQSAIISRIALDSVVGIEAFSERIDHGMTASVSVLATIGGAVLTVAGIVAIACIADPKCFGSCPTVYTDDAGDERLEAELFSYSIAPLLEGRDVDLLYGRPGKDGVLRLDVRNEAMETHYINHLELLEVRHEHGERVVPERDGLPIALRGEKAPLRASDRAGRDLAVELRDKDDVAPVTPEPMLASAVEGDFLDHLDLVFPRPRGDSAVIVLRLRNSLLNTVLFYDMMLGAAGVRALDWMGDDLQRIGPAVKLGRWWTQRMGMRVAVDDGNGYREVARLPDTGPIAWSEVGLIIPAPPGTDDSLRIRLTYVVDAWRIDRVALAEVYRRVEPRVLAIGRVVDAAGEINEPARAALSAPDEDYVQTTAGDRFVAEFDVGPEDTNGARTLLLAAQGYYTEWVRPAWIRAASDGVAFVPSDESLVEAIRRWRTVRPEFERRFHETRIPTR